MFDMFFLLVLVKWPSSFLPSFAPHTQLYYTTLQHPKTSFGYSLPSNSTLTSQTHEDRIPQPNFEAIFPSLSYIRFTYSKHHGPDMRTMELKALGAIGKKYSLDNAIAG